MNKKKILGICGIVVAIIVIVIIVCVCVGKKDKDTNIQSDREEIFRDIRINEDLSIDGRVENLDNVRWNHVNIMQFDKKMDVNITLNNESETQEIPSKDLEIKFLDKNGDEISTQNVRMEPISANYGYTYIDLSFDIDDFEIVYDIQIKAK